MLEGGGKTDGGAGVLSCGEGTGFHIFHNFHKSTELFVLPNTPPPQKKIIFLYNPQDKPQLGSYFVLNPLMKNSLNSTKFPLKYTHQPNGSFLFTFSVHKIQYGWSNLF